MNLPVGLSGPVQVALSRSVELVPPPGALLGGCVYEPKWDGFRLVVVHGDLVRLWSRRGAELTDRFHDVAAAVAVMVPPGAVLDGEVVVWGGDRLDFDALQRRLTRKFSDGAPASYIAFDLLAVDGEDLRSRRFVERRSRLETLATGWKPPLQVTPKTTDVDEARRWFADYPAAGVEGLVVKGAASTYRAGARDWLKVKHRRTEEVIVGAVLGELRRPEAVIAGRYHDDTLVIVGRTTPLKPRQSAELAALLTPAGPDHPWPDTITSNVFGRSGDTVPLVKVTPKVVAEVNADPAMSGVRFRHSLRFLRVRHDLAPRDVS